MNRIKRFKPGMTVWSVAREKSPSYTVLKVGTKWLTLQINTREAYVYKSVGPEYVLGTRWQEFWWKLQDRITEWRKK